MASKYSHAKLNLTLSLCLYCEVFLVLVQGEHCEQQVIFKVAKTNNTFTK